MRFSSFTAASALFVILLKGVLTGCGGGSGSGCAGSAPQCSQCGGEDFASCIEGEWMCGSDGPPLDCNTCTRELSCDACEPLFDYRYCDLDINPSCVGDCNGPVCSTCNMGETKLTDGCFCSCEGSQFVCKKTTGCCVTDDDCSAIPGAYCANNVCKTPDPSGCFRDEDCMTGQSCIGAMICSCGSQCIEPDQPGTCM